MKKSVKYLIVTLVVVVVLVGVVLALVLTAPKTEEEDASSSVDASIKLVEKEEADIASIEVTREDGSYKIYPKEETDDEGETSLNYLIEGLEDAELKLSAIKAVAKLGYVLEATRDLGEVDDLAAYGLDKPQVSVKVNYTDGATYGFAVGNEAPNGGYYLKVDGESKLYTSALNTNLFNQKFDFVDTTVLTITVPEDSETGANVYSYLKISGEHYPEPIEINNENVTIVAEHQIISPDQVPCDSQAIQNLVTTLESLTAERVAAVNPTAEELETFGLAKPDARLDVTVNGESHTLMVSAPAEGSRYLMIDDRQTIYVVSEETVALWADTSVFQLRASFIHLPNIADVDKVTIETAAEKHEFSLSREVDEENTTEEETAYNYSVAGSAKQELTYTTFQKFYQVIIGVQIFGETEETVSGDPYLTLTYHYYEGGQDVIRFYESKESDRSYVVTLNDKVQGTVRKTNVESVLKNAQDMENDKNISVEEQE